MEGAEAHEQFEEFIAGRLIHQADVFADECLAEKMSDEIPKKTDDVEIGGEVSVIAIEESTSPVAPDVAKTADAVPARIDVKVEKSLMSLGFFTPSSRRVKKEVKRISFTRVVDGRKVEASAEFHPSPAFGLPVTADQDKFLALHYIIAEQLRRDGRVENPIRFTTPQLRRLLNIKGHGGKNYAEISEWLDVMTTTTIISNGVIYEKDRNDFVRSRDRFHVFDRARTVGQTMPDGSVADANYVWLSEWQLKNINEKYLLPVDLEAYRELRTRIARALVPLLQVWLYASQRAGSFEKKYDELCEMLSLKIHSVPSLIKQQLQPAFDELVRFEYLREWRIERTLDRRFFKVVFFHGEKFRRDRRRAIEEKSRVEQVEVIAESEPVEVGLPIPGRLEDSRQTEVIASAGKSKPRSKRSAPKAAPRGKKPGTSEVSGQLNLQNSDSLEVQLLDELSARGFMPSVAMKLLKGMSPERLEAVGDYIDFWDETRKTKEVGIGLLHSLIKDGEALPASFVTRKQRLEREAGFERARKLRMLQEAMNEAYEEHCSRLVDRFIAEELPAGEFERRLEERTADLRRQGGLWQITSAVRVAELAAKAVKEEIAKTNVNVPFKDFYGRQLPAVLAKLGFSAAEIGLEPASGWPSTATP